jgi:hypothetical protein
MERRKFISQASLLGFGMNGFSHVPLTAVRSSGMPKDSRKADEPLILSLKIVKAKAGHATGRPYVRFLSPDTAWSSDIKADKYGVQSNQYGELDGENLREIYFSIRTKAAGFTKEQVTIVAPGIEAARVIVGHSDVPFRQKGDEVTFGLTDDRNMGQYMKSKDYQSPLGGYPIGFIHNWDIRRAGKYALEDFPYKRFQAVPNYLLAAQEVLRQMGNMGPGDPKPFKGEISLLGSEVASSRGHMDYPPHVHIMLYEFDKDKNWKSRLAPHFYMDDDGYIMHNHYSRIVGDKGSPSGEYGVGEVVSMVDAEGNRGLDLVIEPKGGLSLIPPDGRRYSIRPDPEKGPTEAVIGYFNDQMICKAEVRDHPDLGVFRLRLEVFTDGVSSRVVDDGYLYDPFTATRYRDLYKG